LGPFCFSLVWNICTASQLRDGDKFSQQVRHVSFFWTAIIYSVVLITPFDQARSHDSRSNCFRVHDVGSVPHQASTDSTAQHGRPHCSTCGIDFQNDTLVHHFFVHSFPYGFDNHLPGAHMISRWSIVFKQYSFFFVSFTAFLACFWTNRPFNTTRVLTVFLATWFQIIPFRKMIPTISTS